MKEKKPSTIRRILLLLKNRKKTVAFLVFLIAVSQIATLVVPFISKSLIDAMTNYLKVGGAVPWTVLVYAAIGILVSTLVSSIFQSSYNYHLFKLVTKTEDELRNTTFEKYLSLHALFHHESSSGQIIGKIERGATSVYSILYDIIGQTLLPPMIIFIGTFLALMYENVWIALAVLIPFPIYFFSTRKISEKIYKIEQESNEVFEHISKELYDVAGNVLTVKKFSQEEMETENEHVLMAKARDIQYSAERLWGVVENVQTSISTAGRVVVLILSSWFVLNGQASIGQFVLYITLQNMAYQPLSQLSIIFPRMRRNATRAERLFAVLNEEVHVTDKPDATVLPYLQKQIEFNNVWFSYHGANKKDDDWALKKINLVIPAGKTVALVGRSGSGKTTFINMLMRSYDPQKGKILIDDKDIRDVTQKSLREQIAVVPQEVDLFSRTVSENIAYGREGTNQIEIENAAKTALAHDFILKIEKGYDTVVGERGIKLSGGERQRVGIARAVLRDPRILILDEATSHLDSESEKLITKATDALIKDRTSIIIAHRLSTVLHADMIIVFKDNQIEATGRHEELLKKSPTYKKLYNIQFADNSDEKN